MMIKTFINILKQLFTPINYLRINHPLKSWFDIYIPLFLTVITVSILFFLPHTPAVFGEGSIVFMITDLIKILVGFYIASLAAIATFPRVEMDELISGDSATLVVERRGKLKTIELTRRRFLCYLFGYLAFVGMFLYFSGSAASMLKSSFQELISPTYLLWIKWVFISGFTFITFNLFITTLLGLHYMTDRIHR